MRTQNHNNNCNYNPPPSGPDGTGDSTGPVRVKTIFQSLAILNFLQVNMTSSTSASTLPMSSPATGLVTGNVDYSATTSSNHGDIDRLSAVPSSGMVRDPNFVLLQKEETRPKRASSIGASLRRLFSKSPAKERSSSDTQGSLQGPETPESAPITTGRGRTPPRQNTSSLSDISGKSSTLPPDNQFYIPTKIQRELSDRNIGG